MKFVNIKYTGARQYRDRTSLRTVWEPGDTNLVSEGDAKLLLRYIEFERVPDAKATATGEAQAKKAQAVVQQQAKKAERQAEAELLEIEQMNKEALEAYARQNFGVELDKRRSVDSLRLQVTELAQGGVA